MNLERIREWLIQQGVSEKELDEVKESPIIKDIGHALTLSLMNDDAIGLDLFALMVQIDELKQRIAALEGGN